jgi:NADH:ubiquinone reductase (H+-translocating)
VTLIDRQNHHCVQPLLYQVATAALTPADVAWPIRGILASQANTRVVMAEVQDVDLESRVVRTDNGDHPYDHLVVATGATHAYFGRDDWEPFAPGLKRVEDATEIRRRLLTAFEKAELSLDEARRRALMTFVVVGGGPTGVEMAGAIADLARGALAPDFRNIDPREATVLLVEAGPRLLNASPEALSDYARRVLEARGVRVLTARPVTGIGSEHVLIGDDRLDVGAVIWAAGVTASPAARWLGAPRDRAGRVVVDVDLSLPDRPEILVLGDTASVKQGDGTVVPGVAPAAKQMGRYAAELISARVSGARSPPPFRYRHQGDLATIGRRAAVVRMGMLTLRGFAGWVFWSVVHVYFLIGLRNRIGVAFSWMWDYFAFGRRARLITQPPIRSGSSAFQETRAQAPPGGASAGRSVDDPEAQALSLEKDARTASGRR